MKTKMTLFKHTFFVLSIMCLLLLISTTIIFALSELSANSIKTSDIAMAAESSIKSAYSEHAEDTEAASSQTVSGGQTSEDDSAAADTAEAGQISDNSVSGSTDVPDTGDIDVSDDSSNDDSGNTGEATGIQTPGKGQTGNTYSPPASITISAVGDIMAHQGNLNSAFNSQTKKYDFSGFFQFVKPYLTSSDLTIGNFETVTAGPGISYKSYPLFNTPDNILAALAGSGFDILTTANNHCLDCGTNGLTRTIQKIKENKMTNIGSSANGKDKYTIKEINGIKVAILSYSQFFNGHDAKLGKNDKSKYLSYINETQIRSDIKTVKSKGADAVIAVMHWGNEYQRTPSTYQTNLAKKMLSWGVDIILGSHPHVIQKSEIVNVNGKDKFIIYSMGNFISGYRRTDKAKRPNKVYTEDGIILQFKLEKDKSRGGIIIRGITYVPTWVDRYYTNNHPIYKVLPIPSPNVSASYINSGNKAYIKQSYSNTMSLMTRRK